MSTKNLIKKEIEKLPESLLDEVLDFIKYLEAKQERRRLTRAAQKSSEEAFEKIWNNKDDSVYDRL